ncbi:MAG: hypothetical protein DRO01_04570 [Thermoproteota archaeon]|nr:MAG: hypothetical protein DRO01_04570 [Candidatus Korarchaeota archaeon]
MREDIDRILTEGVAGHEDLVRRVESFLHCYGFKTACATYHTIMPPDISEALKRLYIPTAIYLRHRADRIAVLEDPPLVFEWEAKTAFRKIPERDMYLEALPLVHHICLSYLDVKCLYVYFDPFNDLEIGFWVDDLPKISHICLPASDYYLQGRLEDYFKKVFSLFLPEVPIRKLESVRGSGEPFAVVRYKELIQLPHWGELILEQLERRRNV